MRTVTGILCFAVGLVAGAILSGVASIARPDPLTRPKATVQQQPGASGEEPAGALRIIGFGAHPDDCEIRAGGSAALWAEHGYAVKFVSATNGDIGHWQMAGGPLAQRRREEVTKADRMLGAATEVLDIHDGELEPTLENRRKFVRLIRSWRADVVMGHRPNDYHPDHRYVGVLMQDSAFMVAVPFFCPEVPHLTKNPVYLYYYDRFQRPTPFRPDIVVPIDKVIDKKVNALLVMESQFIEGGALGYLRPLGPGKAAREARRQQARAAFLRRNAAIADQFRDRLIELYGPEVGRSVKYAEAFEICEYGRQPTAEELRQIFPFAPWPEK